MRMAKSMQSKPACKLNFAYHIDNEIEETKDQQDLAPYLSVIPLEILKAFIKTQISKQTEEQKINNTYKILSIDQVIGSDPISEILGYLTIDDLYDIKLICKRWRKLADQAEIKYMKNVHPEGKLDQIWICDSRRTNTKKNEREEKILRIKEIRNNLINILDSREFHGGHAILIRSCTIEIEKYEHQQEYDDYYLHKLNIVDSCKILGQHQSNGKQMNIYATTYGEYFTNDELQRECIRIGSQQTKPCQVIIENINLIPNNFIKAITVTQNCSLTIRNCTFEADCVAIAHYGDELLIDNCTIISRGNCITIGYHSRKVVIRNSQLICKNDYNSCIEYENHVNSRARMYNNHKQLVQVQCQNNTLVSDQYPFIMDVQGQECEYESKLQLTQSGNKWYKFEVSQGNYVQGEWTGEILYNPDDENTWKEKGKVFTKIYKRVGENTNIFKE